MNGIHASFDSPVLVAVHWDDAVHHFDYDKAVQECPFTTVGYFIEETERFVAIAAECGLDTYRGVTWIPKGVIRFDGFALLQERQEA